MVDENLKRKCGDRFAKLGVAGTVFVSFESRLALLDLPETRDSLGPLTDAFWGVHQSIAAVHGELGNSDHASSADRSITCTTEPQNPRPVAGTGVTFDFSLTASPGVMNSSANFSRPPLDESCSRLPEHSNDTVRRDVAVSDDMPIDGYHSGSNLDSVAPNLTEDALDPPVTNVNPESTSLERLGSGTDDHSQLSGKSLPTPGLLDIRASKSSGSTSLSLQHTYDSSDIGSVHTSPDKSLSNEAECSSGTSQKNFGLKKLNNSKLHYIGAQIVDPRIPSDTFSGLKRLRTNANGSSLISPESFTNRCMEYPQSNLPDRNGMQHTGGLTRLKSFAPNPDQLTWSTNAVASRTRFEDNSISNEEWIESTLPPSTSQQGPWASSYPFLQAPVVMPYESPIFIHVQEGNIAESMKLITSGLVSIHSVDPYGLGLLYYAAYYCLHNCDLRTSLQICHSLLKAGADATYPDDIGNTPLYTSVDNVLALRAQALISPKMARKSIQLIGKIFNTPTHELCTSYHSSRQFSPQHKALLALPWASTQECNLERTLPQIPHNARMAEIDDTDCTGRSALAWAVEYGWPEAVETLLRLGADVRQTRQSGKRVMPLLHLAIAGPRKSETNRIAVTQILLQGGADINARDDGQWTPLHVAASWGLEGVVKGLLQSTHGTADVGALDSYGHTARDIALGAGFTGSMLCF
ncbi:ankyrin [Pseudovirgaria hyperparasitica]|uniref:Ankyrin repeat domain-containing protein 54 n=1 Tax=Pseudovirgaria hyperparasitica TaxID=470096 RepID=A0A6A6WEM6_9PEZI|nr:ankyrin [Pseudovirgaria hyperparasitica]KAF2760484.1 ankyrin [Pseudovirgaria hyperparasitica]